MTITLNLKPQRNALLRGFDNEFYGLLPKAELYFGMYRLQLNDLVNLKINTSSN